MVKFSSCTMPIFIKCIICCVSVEKEKTRAKGLYAVWCCTSGKQRRIRGSGFSPLTPPSLPGDTSPRPSRPFSATPHPESSPRAVAPTMARESGQVRGCGWCLLQEPLHIPANTPGAQENRPSEEPYQELGMQKWRGRGLPSVSELPSGF